MYHISVYFDEKTQRRIQEYMEKVALATGNRYMLEVQIPPHITLSAFECTDESDLVSKLEALMQKREQTGLMPDSLLWVSVGVFLPHVIFLQPVLNEYLHRLSVLIYDGIQSIEGVKVRPFYKPLQWLPHSTIAKKLSVQELQQAFEVLQKEFSVFEGNVTRIGLAKMNPHREIMSWELQTMT